MNILGLSDHPLSDNFYPLETVVSNTKKGEASTVSIPLCLGIYEALLIWEPEPAVGVKFS